MGEFRTISLQDTVNAGAVKTLSSRLIGQPFYVRSVQVEFPLGCNGLLHVEIAIDNDDSTPTNEDDNIGDSVFRPYSRTNYIRGNNTVRHFRLDMLTPQIPAFLKVRGNNTDLAAAHTINAIVEIELLRKDEYQALIS